MNGFANRLMARSTGQASGYGFSVLTPRSVSRFEGQLGIETIFEQRAHDVSDFGAPRSIDSQSGNPMKPQYATVPVRNDGAAGTAPPEPQARLQDGAEQGIKPSPRIKQHTNPTGVDQHTTQSTRAAQTILLANNAMPEVIAEVQNERAPSASPSKAHDERLPSILPDFSRQPHTEIAEKRPAEIVTRVLETRGDAQMRQSTPVANAARQWEQPQAPSISIGKIEVHFLPRETLAPPPVQAPRKRGFDGYTRARRGEPG